MTDTFAAPPRTISSRPLLQCLDALLLGKAAQTLMHTGKQSEFLLIKKGGYDGFSSVSFVVDMP